MISALSRCKFGAQMAMSFWPMEPGEKNGEIMGMYGDFMIFVWYLMRIQSDFTINI